MEEGKTLHLPLLTSIYSLHRNSTSVADPGGGTRGEGVRTLPFPNRFIFNCLFDAEILAYTGSLIITQQVDLFGRMTKLRKK